MNWSPAYRQVEKLTTEEEIAVRAYGAESGLFHLFSQQTHYKVLDEFEATRTFLVPKLAALNSATQKFELTSSLTVYSGHGNGIGVYGSLGRSPAASFRGMIWQYQGVTSTSAWDWKAAEWLEKGRAGPVLLQFELQEGFRCLPMCEIESTHEAEFVLPANQPFKICDAYRSNGVLQFTLRPVTPAT